MALVFISHSSRDNDAAQSLKSWLGSIGLANSFLDFDKDAGFAVGSDWERRLYQEIERAQAVILVLTPAWLESKWCFAEFTPARALGKAIFPVIMSPLGERFFASDIQSVDITKEGEGGLERLGRALTEIALDAQGGFQWDRSRSPFPGLHAFEAEDAAVFFGRNDDIRRVVERLNARRAHGGARLLALLAASGAGKSSLLRAGLIPRLQRDVRNWIVFPLIRPRTRPLEELARAASIVLGNSADWHVLHDRLAGAAPGDTLRQLAEALQARSQSHSAHILLPIDQGEELFTTADPRERKSFLEVVSAASSGELPFICLLAMRADYLGELQKVEGLSTPFEEISLKPMPLDRVGEIIRGPARVAGVQVEEELVTTVMRDAATPDALPLLAFTLRELYDRVGQGGRLTLDGYNALADAAAKLSPLENAVRRAADEAIAAAAPAPEQLDALRQAFVASLVGVNEQGDYVRRPASWTQLPEQAQGLLNALVAARLLVVRSDGESRQVEVAHEALLSKWPRLRDWLDREREFLIGKGLLQRVVADWQKAPEEQKQEALLSGLQLSRAWQWLGAHSYALSPTEQDFIRQSQRHAEAVAARRARLRRLLMTLTGVSSVVFGLLSAIAVWEWRLSEINRAMASHNLGLALLTEAGTLMQDERPARTYLTAGMAAGKVGMPGQAAVPHLAPQSDAFVQAQTIAAISGAAARFPIADIDHGRPAHAIALSPDGRRLAYAGLDQIVSLVDLPGTTPRVLLRGHRERINKIEFAPSGKLVATAGFDGTIGLWDVDNPDHPVALCGHRSQVREVDFDAEGKLIASASNDGTVRVWDVASRQEVKRFEDVDGWALSVRFGRKAGLIAYSDQKGNIVVRDTVNWEVKQRIRAPETDLISLSFSPDSRFIAAAGVDGTARIWRAVDGGQAGLLPQLKEKLWRIAYSPDGRYIATASWEGNVRLWDGETFAHVASFDGHDHWVNDLAFAHPSTGPLSTGPGDLMATASEDGHVRLWRTDEPSPMFKAVHDHDQEVLTAAFSSDGSKIVTGGRDGKAFIYHLDEHERLIRMCPAVAHLHWVNGLAISPDGKLVASVGTAAGSTSNVIKLTDTTTCASVKEIALGATQIHGLQLSAGGRLLAAASPDGIVRIWSIDGTEKARLTGHSGAVEGIDFDPSGRYLVSAGIDKKIIVWDTHDGSIHKLLQGHDAQVWRVKFSPDGRTLVSGGGERRIKLWDWRAGTALPTELSTPSSVAGLAFNGNGTRLFIGDDNRSLAVWDTTTWQRVGLLAGPVGVRGPVGVHPTLGLAFDGEKGRVLFWNFTRQLAAVLPTPGFRLAGTKVTFAGPEAERLSVAPQTDMPATGLKACRATDARP